MKKTFITIAFAIAMAVSANGATKAVNDTTKVSASTPIKVETETATKKDGESKTEYYLTIGGVTYKSNKTSAERYAVITRFGGQPCVVIITNASGKKRAVVL